LATFFVTTLSIPKFRNSTACAQITSFTYEECLREGGAPAAGLHDFRFSLFDAPSGGTQVGSTLCLDNGYVAAGVFTVQLDFGPEFATTADRYVEVQVRRDSGLDCTSSAGFIALGPRQEITPAPMAGHANAAFSLDAADGSPTNAVFVDVSG